MASAGLLPAIPAVGASAPPEAPAPLRLTRGWEYYRGALGGIWEVWRGDAASSNVAWTPVELPHCFNAWDAVDPDREYYEGPGWYRTTLPGENPFPGGRTLLHFEGAGQRSEVFVGRECVGRHLGGYDEFRVDITDALGRAAGRVAVLCDNSRDLETIPSDLSDFNRYGGLYRHVNLMRVPAVSVDRLRIDAEAGAGQASASVKLRLWNPSNQGVEVRVDFRITDPAGRVVAEDSKTLAAWSGIREVARVPVDAPALWSPAEPNLYRCRLTAATANGAHTVEERFGFRWFEFPEHGVFRLNGQKLFLRGTQRHEDHAGVAAAMTDDMTARELKLVKEMGANFIRLGHYQQSQRVLELCDELGLVVWEEIPWCRGGVGGPQYREQARRMLGNMIEQHRNHPSVVFWGLGNENDWPGDFEVFDRKAVRAFVSELNDLCHREDSTRLTALRRCTFASDIPDVYSPSIWAGWYSGRYTEYKAAAEKEAKKVRRMLHMEWGGDSHAGRHSEDPERLLAGVATGQGVEEKDRAFLLTGGQQRASRDGDWSETYICNLYDWYLKEQETMDWMAGSAQWVFKDFSTPLRPENPVPRVNQKGVLERDLTPKEGFYVFQSYWSERPMAHILGHSWPVRWGAPGERKLVKVYSNCPSAELFLNGVSLGVRQRNSQDFPAAGLRWLAPFQEGKNHLRVVARKNAIEIADEIRFEYQTAAWGKPAQWSMRELGRSGGVVTAEVRLLDAAGVQCLDARNRVRFAVAGDGQLIQNTGVARGSRIVELQNGRAVAQVRLSGGTAVLSVSAQRTPTAVQTIRG
jgi:beta-galactosidase